MLWYDHGCREGEPNEPILCLHKSKVGGSNVVIQEPDRTYSAYGVRYLHTIVSDLQKEMAFIFRWAKQNTRLELTVCPPQWLLLFVCAGGRQGSPQPRNGVDTQALPPLFLAMHTNII
jgi:hypothetical protein